MRIRLDKLMVERGMVPSRERAASLIMAGRVLVDEQKQTRAGTPVDTGSDLRLLGSDIPFVSRGGLKLLGALQHWGIDLNAKICSDIGVSTGGFTDCMLQNGAAGVVGADTGYGQIALTLRDDRRVNLLERCNARLLNANSLWLEAQRLAEKLGLPTPSAVHFLAMDVSFISVALVLPAVLKALAGPESLWRGEAVILVKPQFEAGREWVGKGGIVRNEEGHRIALERVKESVLQQHGDHIDVTESPIEGGEGNREFLLHARF